MPNEYSIEIHNYITAQIRIHEQERANVGDDGTREEIRYLQGKLDELHWLRRYLADNVDLKNFTYY